MCSMLKTEPNPDELPVERSDLSEETQEVLHLYDKLPARWEGMTGHYLGKDLQILPILFKEFKISRYMRLYCWDIIPIIDRFVADDIAKQIKRKSEKLSGSREKSNP